MKPQLENIYADALHSFRVKHSVLEVLDSPWHHHEAYELFYIHRSQGTRFVGDHIGHFEAGELVLMGPHLPHVWKNDEESLHSSKPNAVEAICVQFEDSVLGRDFFNLPELEAVRTLLSVARRGLLVPGEGKQQIINRLWQLVESQGVRRIVTLIEILDDLSGMSTLQPLCSEGFIRIFDHSDSGRINHVFHYLTENFKRNLSLEDVADVAHMSKTAFCRYFKARTRKTFLEYLNEMRIGYACKLLVERDKSIAEVVPLCGFQNYAYFSRQFKRVTGYAPGRYRAQFNQLK